MLQVVRTTLIAPSLATRGNELRIDTETDDVLQSIYVEDEAADHGLGSGLTYFLDPVDLEEELFSTAQHEAAEALGAAEALRLNSQDVSIYAKFAPGANLRIGTGQSFMAGAALARLFLSASRLTLFTAMAPAINLANRPCFTVGPDSRCVDEGPVYTPFNGGDLALYPIVENFIDQTGSDLIHSAEDIAIGNYDDNDRGGTPEAVRDVLSWILRNVWNGNAPDVADAAAAFTVAMNHAKTDGSIAEVGSGDGLSRMQSLIEVFHDAITGFSSGDPSHCDLVDINHGEADEAAATTTFESDWQAFADAIEAKLGSELGQFASSGSSGLPAFIMNQVGGPKYGTIDMLTANAQVDMMLDIDGASARFFLVGAKYEVPSFYFQQSEAVESGGIPGFPVAFHENGHPTLAGNVLMGMRSAIATHYIQDRNENYWIPFPFRCFYEGKNFLLVVPNKFPPLREVWMVCGSELQLLDSLGISFENADGGTAPVEFARVVPGHFYLIEGRCAGEIADFPICKTGRRNGPLTISGFTNIRDSFDLHLPIDTPLTKLPFDANQTIHAEGFVEDPKANGLGRFLQDVPGWVGKPDLGNPCARRTITAEVFP